MVYDAVLCVGPQHKNISLKAIKSLLLFCDPRIIFIITSRELIPFFETNIEEVHSRLRILDEDHIIKGITLQTIQEYFLKRTGSLQRAGWYFQQFLKMSISRFPMVADYYLIWDSDSIVLQPLNFFDKNGKVLINPKTEYHKPYFDIIKTMLGIERCVDFSFITEHLMVYKRYMSELIDILEDKCSKDESWIIKVLDNIDDQHIGGAGFSEYETYGNFVVSKNKDSFTYRSLRSIRNGSGRFGIIPDKYAIFYLMLANYSIATFETWKKCCMIRIVLHKIFTRILFIGSILINTIIKCFDKQLIASNTLL